MLIPKIDTWGTILLHNPITNMYVCSRYCYPAERCDIAWVCIYCKIAYTCKTPDDPYGVEGCPDCRGEW